jgi:hypothetical protein
MAQYGCLPFASARIDAHAVHHLVGNMLLGDDANHVVGAWPTLSLHHHSLSRENIYTMKLVRRGHPIPKALHANMFLVRSARDAMERDSRWRTTRRQSAY